MIDQDHHILFHEQKNFCLFLTPKAGNSSLKKSIFEGMAEGEGKYESFQWVSPAEVFALKQLRGTISVGFVRHPVDRLISCWADKINRVDSYSTHKSWGKGFYEGMSFDSFVDVVLTKTWKEADVHYRSQYDEMVYHGRFLVDFVFKLEEIATSDKWNVFYHIMRYYDIYPTPLQHLNRSSHADLFVSNLTKLKIHNKYIKDFEVFNYQLYT